INFDLIMGSEEFNASADFGDLAIVMVNGVNYALFGNDAANTLTLNQDFQPAISNNPPPVTMPIEYSGVTALLNVLAPVHVGINTIKIAIGDLGDATYDSGLFIGNIRGLLTGSAGMYVDCTGTSGADNLVGTDLNEQFFLGNGDDVAEAAGGNDVVR